ncbi:non-ribosomal peptide synthetase [Streptomyces sp. NPDC098789]|uniref:non-ribosomal peptide synthetase n=1 Tax=Streptomyces sp. NPDC098789 TaxID=3366098 RepID=UPI0038139F59
MFTTRSQVWTITTQYLDRYRSRASGAAADADRPLPVTGAQRRFLLARHLSPHGRADLVPLFFRFPRGSLDPRRLDAAAGYVAAGHPVLRSRPAVLGGVPVLLPVGPQEPGAYVARLGGPDRAPDGHGKGGGGGGGGGGGRAGDLLRAALAGWGEGPPLRLLLAPADGQERAEDGGRDQEVLALVMDHAVCDERSIGRIIADLSEGYTHGLGPDDLPAARAREALCAYRAAVHAQLAVEEAASGPAALAHWARRLSGLAGAGGRSGPPVPSGAGDGGSDVLSARLPEHSGGGDHGRGPDPALRFPALLTACDRAARVLYGRGPRGPAPLLGYAWGGRPTGAEDVVGAFLNTVPFLAPPTTDHHRTGVAGDADTDAVFELWCADLEHADTPFDEIVRAARAADLPWPGRFDGLLTFEDRDLRPALRLGGVTGVEIHVDGRPLQAPLTVALAHGADARVRMAWERAAFPDGAPEEAFTALLAALPPGA